MQTQQALQQAVSACMSLACMSGNQQHLQQTDRQFSHNPAPKPQLQRPPAGAWVHLPLAEKGSQLDGEQPAGHLVEGNGKMSACTYEVVAPWRALKSLSPDATQLHNPGWHPPVRSLHSAGTWTEGALAVMPGVLVLHAGAWAAMYEQ